MLAGLIKQALAEAVEAGEISLEEIPEPYLERPRDPDHGDWATNVAMQSAKSAKMPPRQIAEIIASRMAGHEDIDAVEIAGPGFINIRLSARALQGVLTEIHEQGASTVARPWAMVARFRSSSSRPIRSARCTWGTGGGRRSVTASHACSSTRGHEVEREFYINDAGVQMDTSARVSPLAIWSSAA